MPARLQGGWEGQVALGGWLSRGWLVLALSFPRGWKDSLLVQVDKGSCRASGPALTHLDEEGFLPLAPEASETWEQEEIQFPLLEGTG